MNRIIIVFIGIVIFTVVGCKTKGLTPEQEAKIAALTEKIDSRNFIFMATSANPYNFRSVPLTSEYYLQVRNDSIISNLPYFGRSYVAPVDPDKIGVKFISTDYGYSIKSKKGLWEITIIPKDAGEVRKVFMSVGNTGYTTLNVQLTSKQPISYYGTVE